MRGNLSNIVHMILGNQGGSPKRLTLAGSWGYEEYKYESIISL